MKTARTFPGIILLGLGLYFILQRAQIELFPGFFDWPTILCLIGIAFLVPAYAGGETQSILPGVLLLGIGLHFHFVNVLDLWPNNIGIFILFVSLGMILKARKTNAGLVPGILLFIISLITIYYDHLMSWLQFTNTGMTDLGKYWPFVLLAIGIYFLISKKD